MILAEKRTVSCIRSRRRKEGRAWMSCTGLWVVWFKRGMYRPGASVFSKGKAGLSAQQREVVHNVLSQEKT